MLRFLKVEKWFLLSYITTNEVYVVAVVVGTAYIDSRLKKNFKKQYLQASASTHAYSYLSDSIGSNLDALSAG